MSRSPLKGKMLLSLKNVKNVVLLKAVMNEGNIEAMANKLNVSTRSVYGWLKKSPGAISAFRATSIEKATKGYVKKEELRPDLFSDGKKPFIGKPFHYGRAPKSKIINLGVLRAVELVGGVKILAEKIGICQSSVSLWLRSDMKRVLPERAAQIEKATGGKVKRSEIRPDVFGDGG